MRRDTAGHDAARCGRDFVFINGCKLRAVPHRIASHRVASQSNATYCEPGLSVHVCVCMCVCVCVCMCVCVCVRACA